MERVALSLCIYKKYMIVVLYEEVRRGREACEIVAGGQWLTHIRVELMTFFP